MSATTAEAVGSEPAREALLAEARVLLAIPPNPHVPLVRDDFFDGDQYVIAMDWVEGTDLDRLLHARGRPGLGPSQVLPWLADAAAALTHLHGQHPPVIHGDVKPANLVLTDQGRVVLVDYGAAPRRPRARRRALDRRRRRHHVGQNLALAHSLAGVGQAARAGLDAAGIERLHLAAGVRVHHDLAVQLERARQFAGLGDHRAHAKLSLRRLGQEDAAVGQALRAVGAGRGRCVTMVVAFACHHRSGDAEGQCERRDDEFVIRLHAATPARA